MIALLASLSLAQEPPLPPEPPEPPVPAEAPAPPVPPAPPIPPRFVGDDEVSITGPSMDVFAMGGKVSIDERIGDNAFLLGGQLHVVEPIDGDLFATGGEITIDAPVHGDVYSAGGEIRLGEKGSIDGSLIVFGGEVVLDGPIGGQVSAGAGQVRMYGPIGGDVHLEAGQIQLGEDASIGGDLTYATPERVDGLDARVEGEIQWVEPAPDEPAVAAAPEPEPGFVSQALSWSFWKVWGYLTKVLVGTAIFLLGGSVFSGMGRKLLDKPAESLGWGLGVMVGLPAIATLALILVIPFPLGVVGYTVYFLGLYLAQLVAAQALGDLILERVQPGAVGKPVLSMAVGLVPLMLLIALPWFGVLAWTVATVFGFGAAWLRLRELASA